MAKKKQNIPKKKSSSALIYAGVAVLVIAALVWYMYSSPATEKPLEKIPAAGKYLKIDKSTTYEAVYLFNWDEIPGKDNERLIEFLKQNFSIDWVKAGKIEKINDGKTIKVSNEKNNLSLRFNDEKTKVNLTIDDGRTDEFIAETENGKINIYEPKVKMIEFLKFNCGHCYALNLQLPAIKKKYGEKLEITYKPMLWRSVPGDKPFMKSIEAYILAERMGKGEEMKDALFKAVFVEKRDLSSDIVLGDIARSVGLGDEFVNALKNGDAKAEAEANIRLAESIPVDETPTIILNGNLKINPALTSEDIPQMIENLGTVIDSLLV